VPGVRVQDPLQAQVADDQVGEGGMSFEHLREMADGDLRRHVVTLVDQRNHRDLTLRELQFLEAVKAELRRRGVEVREVVRAEFYEPCP